MIKVSSLKIPAMAETARDEAIRKKLLKLLRLSGKYEEEIKEMYLLRESIDARDKKNVLLSYDILVATEGNEDKILKRINRNDAIKYTEKKYSVPISPVDSMLSEEKRPYIIGAGPAGLFAALYLSMAGLCPVVVERGKETGEREKDVSAFLNGGKLLPDSNVLFGEGGAGTFSDGKLNTQIKDREGRQRFILSVFYECGAPEKILYEAKPHIGTDSLLTVIPNLRKKIESLGGTFFFDTTLTDISVSVDGLNGIVLNQNDKREVNSIILSPGHSARDTFYMLKDRGLNMSAKDFSVGFRVEHPQEMINRSQYGTFADVLPNAPYKLSKVFKEADRGVYSFCMCPGGKVINSSSEEEMLSVNGMSETKRDGNNANSAIVISVDGREFDKDDPLSGIEYQRSLERKAYKLCEGRVPKQLFSDFKKEKESTGFGSFETDSAGVYGFSDLSGLLSDEQKGLFLSGMEDFGKKIEGFDREDAILSGIESRTSSPVRIERGEDFMSNIRGIYPCGEGAGYAGGIMSAAIDGLKCAERLFLNYKENGFI